MSGPRFSNAAFAVNRWNVGCQAPPSTAAATAAVRDHHIGQQRSAKFKASKEKAKLRPELLAIDPHCHRCGLRLQDVDPSQPDYASVFLAARLLSCRACVQNPLAADDQQHEQTAAAAETPFGEGVLS